jgi:thiol:disulfide interchange protein DsbD
MKPNKIQLIPMKKFLFILFFIPLLCYGFQPLPVDKAFVFSDSIKNGQMELNWKIAPGYHLYRDHLSFQSEAPSVVQLQAVTLPEGILMQDNILGKYRVFENKLTINIPLIKKTLGEATLLVRYQGCADSGFCYPPVTKRIQLSSTNSLIQQLTPISQASATTAQNTTVQSPPETSTKTQVSNRGAKQDRITRLLSNKNWGITLLGFLGFGLLLAFTPCVLPMIPILSGIIVGQGREITTTRAFCLSLTYVLAMALTYAGAGVLAGMAGSYLQAFLQSPWVIFTFAGIFVLLAFSLFGFYELRVPNFLNHHVTNISNKQSSGTYVGVAVMGMLSTLIVSPCISAPLIGVLSYIGKTGDAFFGGLALFMLGFGAGIPLLIVGTTEGKFLPKSGPWMNSVKIFFGVFLLAAAIWLLQRVIPEQLTMVLWAALLIISAVYMGAFTHAPETGWGKLWKGLSLILMVYGLLLLIGATMGNTDPLQPLAISRPIPTETAGETETFKIVKTLKDVETEIAAAKKQSKPVILDFYADWCISCQQMDRYTFTDQHVKNKLRNFVMLRADVTDNDANDQALEKHFDVIAPPTILFFNDSGDEIKSQRVVGEIDAKELLKHLRQTWGQCETRP